MFKYLVKFKIYAPLLPPLGDIPHDQVEKAVIESYIWGKSDSKEEIRIIFPRPLKKGDSLSQDDPIAQFYYNVEVLVPVDTIENAASRAVYLLEQVLDTSSLFSQASSKIKDFVSVVNLTQIEEIIKNKSGSFEKGVFMTPKLKDVKVFPPGRLVFLTDKGAKKIGRNLFWFRRGLTEMSSLERFISFFTAFKELGEYFKELPEYKNMSDPLVSYVEEKLRLPKDTFKKWSDLRGKIIHFGNKLDDFQTLNKEAKGNLEDVYKTAYYGIMRFFTDNPPVPSPIIFFDDLDTEIVKATSEIVEQLTAIQEKRNKGYKEVAIK
ncbi:MAG TPA: hypothetical protein ENI23_10765 [bacterium]|nr:hypothetical protein [bacterium]